MINIGAEDYNVLKQQYIKKYIRLELLDFQYNIVDELSGNMTKCSINVDSNSDLRRSCDLGFVVTTSTFDIKAGSKLWLGHSAHDGRMDANRRPQSKGRPICKWANPTGGLTHD